MLVHKDFKAYRGRLVHQELKVARVVQGQLAYRVHQDHKAGQVRLDFKEDKAFREVQARQVLKGQLAALVLQVRQDHRVL